MVAIQSFPNLAVPADIPDAHTALPSDPKTLAYFSTWLAGF